MGRIRHKQTLLVKISFLSFHFSPCLAEYTKSQGGDGKEFGLTIWDKYGNIAIVKHIDFTNFMEGVVRIEKSGLSNGDAVRLLRRRIDRPAEGIL
jgi:hypothetical protein